MHTRALAIVIMLLVPSLSAAQGTTSRVAGTVTDKSGGIIPGAAVTLTSDTTAITLSTTTNNAGSYAFDSVQIGRYTLAVELHGFKRFIAPDVPVTIGEPTTVNAALEPGGISESVEEFTTPGPGQFSNTGRNYFRGPGGYFVNLSLSKRTRTIGRQILEFRVDSTNVTNHPVFGFPTLTSNATTFGRIRNSVTSGSRKIMLGAKYYF